MVNGQTLSQQKYLTVIKISIILWQSKLMCSIDLHIIQSNLLKIILDSKFYMVIYEVLKCTIRLLNGQVLDDGWPSDIITELCNSGLSMIGFVSHLRFC